MAIPERLKRFLEERNIEYRAQTHPEAFTAQQVAQASRVPGRAFAKAVVLQADGKTWLAVLPATERVDFRKVRECLGARKVRMAAEAEFASLFPDCEVGAMPIFGSLYGLPVMVSEDLAAQEEIAFTAGSHRDVVRLRMRDYLEAERPRVCQREELHA